MKTTFKKGPRIAQKIGKKISQNIAPKNHTKDLQKTRQKYCHKNCKTNCKKTRQKVYPNHVFFWLNFLQAIFGFQVTRLLMDAEKC